MAKVKTTLSSNHKTMLRRRGLEPKYYEFVKETYYSLYVRDTRSGKVKIIYKHN